MSLFAGDMLLYVENPKDHQETVRTNKQSHYKLQDIKSVYKNHLCLYALKMNYQRN